MINLDQILSAARWLVTTIGTYFASKGTITGDQVQLIGGAVAALISLGWSFYAHANTTTDATPTTSGDAAGTN
jgi:hypothetical protein